MSSQQKKIVLVLIAAAVLALAGWVLLKKQMPESQSPLPLQQEPLTREQLIETSSGKPGHNISSEERQRLIESSSGH